MTKEEIIKKHMSTPPRSGLEWVEILDAMDEWAKERTIAFTNWTAEGDCQYSCTDEDQWTSIDDPLVSITTEQLYNIFIEIQSA